MGPVFDQRAGPQDVHAEAPSYEYVSAGQFEHALAVALAVNLPAGHKLTTFNIDGPPGQ